MFWANEDTETKFTLVLVSFLFFKKYIFLHVYLLVYDKNYALHISRDTRVALDNILRTPFLVPTIVKVLPPLTTGNRLFAECFYVCRVHCLGHSANKHFAECCEKNTRQNNFTR